MQLLPRGESGISVQSLNISQDSIFWEGWCHLKTSFASQRGELIASHSGGKFAPILLSDGRTSGNNQISPEREIKSRRHEVRSVRRRIGRILSDRIIRKQSPTFCGQRRAELFLQGLYKNCNQENESEFSQVSASPERWLQRRGSQKQGEYEGLEI